MKLSGETLTVLKNFANINQGIQFKKGVKLSTISPGKTVLAQAVLKDDFPQEFCVYDLNEFLSVYSLFKDPAELSFDAANVILKGGRSKIKYRTANKETIVVPPEKELKLSSVDCSFTLKEDDYSVMMKTANVLSSPNIGIVSDGEVVEVVMFDASNDSTHTNSIQVAEGDGRKYNIVFKTENIKMLPGEYKVEISFKGIGHFTNTKEQVEYWIAFESKGTTY